jgi:Fe-S-cluster containining protein
VTDVSCRGFIPISGVSMVLQKTLKVVKSCDSCHAPGACCKGFVLTNMRVKDDLNWKESSEIFLTQKSDLGLTRFYAVSKVTGSQRDGTVAVRLNCSSLTKEGRCGDYENRPNLCRVFEPGSDPLCAEYDHAFKGIPIIVMK